MVWKFRFYLSSHKKALTKFLKCINWKLEDEVTQALWMLANWAPMDVEDALELLSPTFTHPQVRKYAVSRLAQAPDEDLLLYLLQLVQALKYEDPRHINHLHGCIFPDRDVVRSMPDDSCSQLDQSSLSDLSATSSGLHASVIPANQRAASFLAAIKADKSLSPGSAGGSGGSVIAAGPSVPGTPGGSSLPCDSNSNALMLADGISFGSVPANLCTFLIQRACTNATLANYFYWYLSIEVEETESVRKQDERAHHMYEMVLNMFQKVLENGKF